MSRIPEEKIDEIRSAANIVSYVSRYVALKKTGRSFKGLCPFHKEKTPSFNVSPERRIFHCFGCGKAGDVFKFIMEMEKVSYPEAIRRVADDMGIQLPRYESPTDPARKSEYDRLYEINRKCKEYFCEQLYAAANRHAREYFKSRKLKQTTMNKFDVGYAPAGWEGLQHSKYIKKDDLETMAELGVIQKRDNKPGYYDRFRNRIIFPFHNLSGRIVGFGGRRLDEKDQPKYLNSPESKIYKKGEILYGLHQAVQAIREFGLVFLVEGYFDLLRLVDSKIENVVAGSGTALTEGQARLLKRYTDTVYIAYDSDDAGIKAALRNSEILENNDLRVQIVRLPDGHDPDTFILENSRKDFLDLVKKSISPIEFRLIRFRTEHPNASIEQKNAFIDELLQSLALISNEVRAGLYLHATAEHLEVPESMLIGQLNKLKRRGRYKNRFPAEEKETKAPVAFRRGQWKAEESILGLVLLGDAEIMNMILNSLSSAEFENDDTRIIFEQMLYYWEEHGTIDFQKVYNSLDSDEYKEMLARVSDQTIQNPTKFAADCIYQIRKFHLDSRFNELQKMLQAEQDSETSTMHYLQELTEIRQQISRIEEEHNKYLKIDL